MSPPLLLENISEMNYIEVTPRDLKYTTLIPGRRLAAILYFSTLS